MRFFFPIPKNWNAISHPAPEDIYYYILFLLQLRGFQNRAIHIALEKCPLGFQKLGISDLLGVCPM